MTAENTKARKRFSMIREFHLADFFTLANAACGVGSLFAAISYVETAEIFHFYLAAALVPCAFIFDALDGRIARWRHTHSAMGRELDSLADVISFGVAPAIMAYAAGMRGAWDRAILIFFVACGVSRLARYNVTAENLSAGSDKVKYFEGAPIPSSLLLVIVLTLLAYLNLIGENMLFGSLGVLSLNFHPMSLVFLLHGSLMISKTIRIPKP